MRESSRDLLATYHLFSAIVLFIFFSFVQLAGYTPIRLLSCLTFVPNICAIALLLLRRRKIQLQFTDDLFESRLIRRQQQQRVSDHCQFEEKKTNCKHSIKIPHNLHAVSKKTDKEISREKRNETNLTDGHANENAR